MQYPDKVISKLYFNLYSLKFSLLFAISAIYFLFVNHSIISEGMILYELHAPLLFLAKSQWNAGVIDDAGLKSKMTEAASILQESATILSYELPDTAEGQIAAAAKESLVQLNQSINDL